MKKFILFILLSVLTQSTIYGYECSAKKPNPCAYDYDLFQKCKKTTFVNGEFLFWTADTTNLDYVVRNDVVPPAGDTYAIGNYEVAKYDWDPGFRVSAGWFNAPHYWKAYAQFTWVEIKGSDSTVKPTTANQNLNGTWPQPATINSAMENANSSLKLNHLLGELLVARVFIPNPHLRMSLLGGLDVGKIKQEWTVNYTFTGFTNRIYNEWDYLAGGFKIGFNFDWFWGNNFYLTGNTTAAGLIGKYENMWTMDASVAGTSVADVKYEDYRISYNIQYLFGFSYQKAFTKNRLEIFAGYELNSWYNLHEIIKSTGDGTLTNPRVTNSNSGALSMHGLTARMTLNF